MYKIWKTSVVICVRVWIFRWNRCFFVAVGGGGGRICFSLLGFFIIFALSIHLKSIAWHGYILMISVSLLFFWVEPITQILIKFTYFHSFINGYICTDTHTRTIIKAANKMVSIDGVVHNSRFWAHTQKNNNIINIIWYESNPTTEKNIMLMRWIEFAFISVWLHCIIMEKRTRKSNTSPIHRNTFKFCNQLPDDV